MCGRHWFWFVCVRLVSGSVDSPEGWRDSPRILRVGFFGGGLCAKPQKTLEVTALQRVVPPNYTLTPKKWFWFWVGSG